MSSFSCHSCPEAGTLSGSPLQASWAAGTWHGKMPPTQPMPRQSGRQKVTWPSEQEATMTQNLSLLCGDPAQSVASTVPNLPVLGTVFLARPLPVGSKGIPQRLRQLGSCRAVQGTRKVCVLPKFLQDIGVTTEKENGNADGGYQS